jgi:hypothetical protein
MSLAHYTRQCNICVIKYWVRLLQMGNDKLPKACYSMLLSQDEHGRLNWSSKVKHLLFSLGFGAAWISQDIGNAVIFLNQVKQRILDIDMQVWNSNLKDLSKLKTYTEFKTLLEPELYLYCVEVPKFKRALSRLRCSAHNLEIEVGRHNSIDPELRLCKYCEKHGEFLIEDEFHFVMSCPQYDNLRDKYIAQRARMPQTTENFINIIQNKNHSDLQKFAMFVYYAFKERDHFLLTL